MRRLVAMVDGSQRSLGVFRHAADFAAAANLDLVALHVIDGAVERAMKPEQAPMLLAAKASEDQAQITRQLAEIGVAADVQVFIKPTGAKTVEAILEAATDLHAVVLAMDSRGENMLRTTLLGSTALRVLARSHMPVLMTTSNMEPPPPRPYRILCSTDGTFGAEAVARSLTAALLDADMEASILTVETEERAALGPNTLMPAERFARWFPPHINIRSIRRRREDLDGHLVDEVLETAAAEGANAIAMATHGFKLQRRLFQGSVALGVLARSPVPLLLAR